MNSYPDLQINNDTILGVEVISPSCYHDFRGYYWTVHDATKSKYSFNHDKVTVTKKNVIRGIHGDFSTTKLISCLYGEIYCVVIDKRKESKTYNMWMWKMLSHTNRNAVVLPPGVGLGYLVTSHEATVLYKLAYDGEYKDVNEQFTFPWNDSEANIFWPIKEPTLQERDQ